MAEPELRALAERVQATCVGAGIRVGIAESCTGGRVGDALTDLPGSSAYLAGSLVAYADAAKTAILGVPEAVLLTHGAVSAQVAVAMADGARQRLEVDVAVAVTGIAGPGGATPEKPVGLTYVASSDAEGSVVRRYRWQGDREANKSASARAVLELLDERARLLAGRAAASDAGA
jgi:nicotinamide-nucleotide amidase